MSSQPTIPPDDNAKDAAPPLAKAHQDNVDLVLEWLFPHVSPLLDRDKSHQGKFEAFRKTVNNASHDNAPPSTGDMVHACGEIEHFVKTYLGR